MFVDTSPDSSTIDGYRYDPNATIVARSQIDTLSDLTDLLQAHLKYFSMRCNLDDETGAEYRMRFLRI